MRLLHYSDSHIPELRNIKQTERHKLWKPKGLWVSVEGEDDWRSWCTSEDFREVDKQICYEVTLSEAANVLILSTPQSVLDFSNKYKANGLPDYYRNVVDWWEVTKDYSGVIIAPYQWGLRLDDRVNWYYSWDCASGCIWDTSGVSINFVSKMSEAA